MSVFTLNYRTASAHTAPSLIKRAAAGLQHAVATYRTHSLLVDLDDRLLADVGVTRAQAGHPVNRPVWDAGLR